MKTVILCCASLEKEVRLAMARKGISYPLHILTDNNHDVPNHLRDAIQRELDGIGDANRVLMAFGTCGGAMVGLRTGNFQLILPRVDDCLSLLMGSMEQRYAALQGGFGIFLTESWLSSSRSMENELERIRRVYPPKRAETIIRLMYRNFDSLNVIDTGAYPVESILPRTQALAEQLHLTHRVVPGDSRYLETLLAGPWDAGRFICIPENTVITDADVRLPAVAGRHKKAGVRRQA